MDLAHTTQCVPCHNVQNLDSQLIVSHYLYSIYNILNDFINNIVNKGVWLSTDTEESRLNITMKRHQEWKLKPMSTLPIPVKMIHMCNFQDYLYSVWTMKVKKLTYFPFKLMTKCILVIKVHYNQRQHFLW